MGAEIKAKAAMSTLSSAPVQDEIAEIMNEIESLQQGMAQAAKPRATTPSASLKLQVVPDPILPVPVDEATDPLMDEAAVQAGAEAQFEALIEANTGLETEPKDESLAEFRGEENAEASSMEEILAGMKSDEEDSGTSIFNSSYEFETQSAEKIQSSAESILAAAQAESEADALLAEAQEEAEAEVATQEVTPASQVNTPSLSEFRSLSEPKEIKKMSQPASKRSPEEGCLTLSLQGSMTLKLKYDFQGQEVTLSFDEQCLRVELSDGTEFKIPVVRNNPGRAA